ncbi:MAG: cupredoxin family copper-binding protein [Candidatus Tectomicrobia bacterium]|nr:cupredoxin family copper-binding protein [Candidatus Tectomicrobia bacterium]
MRGAKQNRRWGMVGVIIVTLATAFALTSANPVALGVRHQVDIQRFKFTPASLVVAPGDTVVWVNLDIVPHTITAQDDSWDSQTLQTNDAWELRITEEMTGDYFCRFHPAMVGQVQVKLD